MGMTTDSPAAKAWGIALTTLAADGSVLDAWYPSPQLGDAPSDIETHPLHARLAAAARADEVRHHPGDRGPRDHPVAGPGRCGRRLPAAASALAPPRAAPRREPRGAVRD